MSRTSAETHADWLRRVSDYQSGGVSEAERLAVEDHLATCIECQEALAMYRRFSTLLHSPLRLGAPSMAFDEAPTTVIRTQHVTAPNPSGRFPQGSGQPPSRRRRALAGLAAAVAAALIVAGFLALLAPRLGIFTSSGPKHQQTVTVAPNATGSPLATTTATSAATTTPGLSAFVCANPAGSMMVYAYIRSDHNLYIVKGCNQPKQITSISNPTPGYVYAFPLAWSPSNRYLAVSAYDTNNAELVYLVDTQTGTATKTRYEAGFGGDVQSGDTVREFIGWLDDTTFLAGIQPITSQPVNGQDIGPMTLVRVNAQTEQETTITTITWAARFAIRNNGQYLFYGGFQSQQEGGAWLHRIDLTTGADTKLVPLGIAGPGPCQGTPICPWTAPWDVTADGAHIVYHNPGPTTTPSDTNTPPDTPLYYANPDGSIAVKLSSDLTTQGLSTPFFSPDGQYVTVSASFKNQSPSDPPQIRLAPVNGGPVQHVNGLLGSWRGDSQALIILTAPNGSSGGVTELYMPATGAYQPVEAYSSLYLWGN